MSLNRNIVNPLSVLNLRRLNFIPKHFSRIIIDRKVDIKLLDRWINFNLNSRYSIKKGLTLDKDKKIIEVLEIGMEDPKEITMLALGCNLIHNEKEK